MSDQSAPTAENSRDLALNIITTIETNTGISIKDIFTQDLEPREIRKQMHARILQYVEDRQDKEISNGDWPLAGQQIDVRKAVFGTSAGSDVSITPNVALIEHNYTVVKTYRGQDVFDFVSRITNGLKLLHEGMSPLEAAATIIGSGLASFATAMIVGTAKALIAKKAFRVAVTEGVKAMGKMSVVIGVALVLITELLLYLIFKNKKVFLGLVYNNTSLDLVVKDWRSGTGGSNSGDLFMNTGSITTFMETHLNEYLDSPLCQVTAKIDVGDVQQNLIAGGVFCAEKNAGLFGTEGCMVLSKYDEGSGPSLPRFAAVFACPYTMDNGVNVRIQTEGDPQSAKSLFDDLYSGRGQYLSTNGAGYTFSASCADPRGGDAAGIFTLDGNS